MEIKLLGIGYLEGANVVTVTLCAKDNQGNDHPIQAQWPANDVPELSSLLRKAIEQVGGDLAFKVLEANEQLAGVEPATKSQAVDVTQDSALSNTVASALAARVEARAEAAKAREAEALAAEAAMTRSEVVQ